MTDQLRQALREAFEKVLQETQFEDPGVVDVIIRNTQTREDETVVQHNSSVELVGLADGSWIPEEFRQTVDIFPPAESN